MFSCSSLVSSKLLQVFLFLISKPFFVFVLAWWMWDDSSSGPQEMSENLESTSSWMWNVLTFPLSMIQSLFSSVFHGLTVPFGLFPSFEGFSAVLWNIVMAPWRLLVSIGELLVSFGWSIFSLFQMILASILNFKVNSFPII